jgi:AraC-like DNA-binding protein
MSQKLVYPSQSGSCRDEILGVIVHNRGYWRLSPPRQHPMSPQVPTIHFDTADLPAHERFERWRAAVAAYDVGQPPDASPGGFTAKVDAWMLGDLVVTSNRLSPVRFVRPVEKAKADGIDHYAFLLLKEGSWVGDVGGRMLTAGPGQVVSFDLTRPMDAAGSGGGSITLNVARPAMDAALPRPPDLHGAMLNGSMGRLLADHFLSLVRELPAMEQGAVPTVIKATVGLIASCIAAAAETNELPEPARGSAVRHRIRRYIDQNLTADDLTPARIARDLNLSRSVLYRTFGRSGGVASYVRTRRLEAVHALLSNPDDERSIAEIAYGFGFVSDAHFSRAFRQQFGYSPREARLGTARLSEIATISNEAGPGLFREWIREIG